MESKVWAFYNVKQAPVDTYRVFPHTDPGFYHVLAYEYEQRHAVDLYIAHTNLIDIC